MTAATRAGDPQTSFEAADAVRPYVGNIREQVLAWAADRDSGFIDEELSDYFKDDGSSYRTRRAELTDENWIVDSHRLAQNRAGLNCVVWIHRQFVTCPPPLKSRKEAPTRKSQKDVDSAFAVLDAWVRQMKNEGRLFAGNLAEALQTVKEASK